MLKIKDDVEFEKLEDFGFKKQPKPYDGYYRCISKGVKIIFIYPDRRINIDNWNNNDARIHKNPTCKYRSEIVAEDVLYELIKSNLVESVVI